MIICRICSALDNKTVEAICYAVATEKNKIYTTGYISDPLCNNCVNDYLDTVTWEGVPIKRYGTIDI